MINLIRNNNIISFKLKQRTLIKFLIKIKIIIISCFWPFSIFNIYRLIFSSIYINLYFIPLIFTRNDTSIPTIRPLKLILIVSEFSYPKLSNPRYISKLIIFHIIKSNSEISNYYYGII